MTSEGLPIDVIRIILEEAASLDDKTTAISIINACSYFRAWIEPLIYESVVLLSPQAGDAFASSIRSRLLRNPSFFHDHVKELTLGTCLSSNALELVLSCCTGVQDLSLRHKRSTLRRAPSSEHEHIELLSHVIRFNSSLRPKRVTLSGLNPRHIHPVIQSATHLSLDNFGTCCTSPDQTDLDELSAFLDAAPRLTHLSYSIRRGSRWMDNANGERPTLVEVAQYIEAVAPRLQAVVFPRPELENKLWLDRSATTAPVPYVEDPRFLTVLLGCERRTTPPQGLLRRSHTWRTLEMLWDCADLEVERRQLKEARDEKRWVSAIGA